MARSELTAALDELLATDIRPIAVPLPDPPPDVAAPLRRGLRDVEPDETIYDRLSLEEGQHLMRNAVTTYLADPAPAHMLLIAASAGLGKTTLGVETAERVASEGGVVLYAGPRREFYRDLQALQQHPDWWYEWKPRTLGAGQGIGQTCRYTIQMEAWLRRGYPALDFCSNPRICGWSYVREGCPWHAQARRTEPIIAVQYEHLVLGNPRLEQATLVIGDELPVRAFLHPWHIPAASVVPADMAPGPRRDLLRTLRHLSETPAPEGARDWRGPALLDALGGARHVAAVCADVALADLIAPELSHAEAAEQAPYGHLMHTLITLGREARLALQGREWISRVQVTSDGLTLLLRQTPKVLPPHVIWLDATGDPALYQTLFGRPVQVVQPDVRLRGRIFQVWASLNTKTTLGAAADDTPKVGHIRKQIDAILARGYERPAFISYKDVVPVFEDRGPVAHFHGNRGTNRLQGCDCLIIVGTPQPAVDDLVQTASMLYDERDTPFNTTWTQQERVYAEQAYAYLVSGFWDDPQLQRLLEQLRESELIQAIHRGRPLREPVDVWLLTNLPLPHVPVTLVDLAALFGGAPAGVDVYRWPAVLATADARMDAVGQVTTQDFVTELGANRRTAAKWLDALIRTGNWRERDERVPAAGRGPRVRAIVRIFQTRNCASPL